MRSTKAFSPSIRHFRTIPRRAFESHTQRMEQFFNDAPEPSEADLLRLQLSHLESDLQRAHDENRWLRRRMVKMEATLGMDDEQEAA